MDTTAVPQDGVVGDAALLAAVRSGDSSAMGVLYERHAGAALSVARQYVDSRADADDVVADAFTAVLGALQRGNGPQEAFRAYLFTVVRRVAAVRREKGRRVQPTDDVATLEAGTATAPMADEPALAGFERGVVAQAFHSLPERWQAVLWHTEVEGRQPAEVAPLLGLSANGAAALAYRAREGLRQAYLQQHVQRPLDDGCRAVAGKLGGYVRGGLGARDTSQVESHLDGCGTCRALVLELGDVNHGMRAVIAPLVLGTAGLAAFGHLVAGGAAVGAGAAGSGSSSGSAGGGAGSGAAGSAGAASAGVAGASAAGVAGGVGAAASVAGAGAGAAGTAAAGGGIAALLAAAPVGLVAAVVGGVVVAAAVTVAGVTGVLGGRVQDPTAVGATQDPAGGGGPSGEARPPGPSDLPSDDPTTPAEEPADDVVAEPSAGTGGPGVPATGGAEGGTGTEGQPGGSRGGTGDRADEPGGGSSAGPSRPTTPEGSDDDDGSSDPGTPTGTQDPDDSEEPPDPPEQPATLEFELPADEVTLDPTAPAQLVFTVRNAGPGEVTDLVADVKLPSELALDSAAVTETMSGARFRVPSTAWSCGERSVGSVVCRLGQPLPASDSTQLTVPVVVTPRSDEVQREVKVNFRGSSQPEWAVPVRIRPAPAQPVLDVPTDLPLVVGQEATVRIGTSNAGGSWRDTAHLDVTVPAGITAEPVEVPAGAEASGGPSPWECAPSEDGLACERETFLAGESVPLDLALTATEDAEREGAALAVRLTAGRGEAAAGVPLTVSEPPRGPARLVVTSDYDNEPLVRGDAVEITVTNEGESAAHDVTVEMRLGTPSDLADLLRELIGDADLLGHVRLVAPDDGDGVVCAAADTVLTCQVAEIGPGSSVTFRPTVWTDSWVGVDGLAVAVAAPGAESAEGLDVGDVIVVQDEEVEEVRDRLARWLAWIRSSLS